MKSFMFFVCSFKVISAFIVPAEILKQLTYGDTALIIDRIVVESENGKTSYAEKNKERSIKTNDLKNKENKLKDLVIKDITPKPSNVDERSFVYLKQKHRTPIINLVHGSPDMLGKSNAQPISNLNKAYLRDFTQKQTQTYIDNFLKGYTFLKPTWLLNKKHQHDSNSKNVTKSESVGYVGRDKDDDERDSDTSIDEKIRFVEFLKPPPLIRCEQNKGKHNEHKHDMSHTTQPNSLRRFDSPGYPPIPARAHNDHHHFPGNHNHIGNICDHRNHQKESLCSHIYNSHIEDCIKRLLGKSNTNAVKLLSNCIRDI